MSAAIKSKGQIGSTLEPNNEIPLDVNRRRRGNSIAQP
jgi:hypothetical protein